MKGFDTKVLKGIAKCKKDERLDEKTEYVFNGNDGKKSIFLSEIQYRLCLDMMFSLVHDGYLMLYEIDDEKDKNMKNVIGEIRVEPGICVNKDYLCDVRNK